MYKREREMKMKLMMMINEDLVMLLNRLPALVAF